MSDLGPWEGHLINNGGDLHDDSPDPELRLAVCRAGMIRESVDPTGPYRWVDDMPVNARIFIENTVGDFDSPTIALAMARAMADGLNRMEERQ